MFPVHSIIRRQLPRKMFRLVAPSLRPIAPRLLGSGIGIVTFYLANSGKPLIRNDSPLVTPQLSRDRVTVRRSALGQRLNYQHLAVGSFLGLFSGYVLGKLSKLLTFVGLTSLLIVQFLQSRGIIDVYNKPTVQKFYSFARNHLHVSEFMLEKPSFKFSFLLSALVAAFNS